MKRYLISFVLIGFAAVALVVKVIAQDSTTGGRNLVSEGSADFSRIHDVLKRRAPRKFQIEPKLIKAETISAPASLADWRFFDVAYIPALPSGAPAAVPLLKAVVAISGTEEFVLPKNGTYSEFGQFLNHNKIRVQSSADAAAVTSMFSSLYDLVIREAPEKVSEGHYLIKQNGSGVTPAIRQTSVSLITKSTGEIESFGIKQP